MSTTLVHARWLLTMQDDLPLLYDHALLLANDRIQSIIPPQSIKHTQADTVLHLNNHILMPGFINLHGHSAMVLFRGYADDLALMDWLNQHIWPLEKTWVNDQFVYDGSRLAMAEMLLSGTTTVNDMYFFHDSVAQAALAMRMRTCIGCTILEFPTNYATNAKQYLNKALAVYKKYQGEPLLQFALAPHAPYTVSDQSFQEIVTASAHHNLLIHCHLHETVEEIQQSCQTYGMSPFARLDKLGVLHESFIAAHMVHLTEEELMRSATLRLNIAHNPSSNLKLASGFSPIQRMQEMGINVGIGTDGAASNNRLDIMRELYLASLLAKGTSKNPTALCAYNALKMATINGAKALHINDKVGSLKAGKQADIIAIRLDSLENQPLYDPVSHLVYTLGRENISDVWINGEHLVKNRRLTKISITDLHYLANTWQECIRGDKKLS